MTKDQKDRLDQLTDEYKFCFIVQGYFHAKYNDKRMEKFLAEKKPKTYEFVRVTADTTYVFWNPELP
jgi:hypothetical protein